MKKSAREVSPQEGKFLVSESRKVFVSFKVAAKEFSWKLGNIYKVFFFFSNTKRFFPSYALKVSLSKQKSYFYYQTQSRKDSFIGKLERKTYFHVF